MNCPREFSSSSNLKSNMRTHTNEIELLTFQPGPWEAGIDFTSGDVGEICKGQAKELGVEVGWCIVEVDHQPFSEELLKSKIHGDMPYTVRFIKKSCIGNEKRSQSIPLCKKRKRRTKNYDPEDIFAE